MELSGIKGKVALVTGAAQGIGEAVGRKLAEQGALVAGMDKNAELLDLTITEMKASGLRAEAYPADVSDSGQVKAAVADIEQNMGPIGILVNVAGILRTGAAHALSDDDWWTSFAVNTGGVFNVSRAVVRQMIDRRAGAVVTVGSNAATVPRMHMSAYAASKAAAVMFTKCLGLEAAQHNIRCNIVSPGSTDTAMQQVLWNDEHSAGQVIAGSLEMFRLGIPLGKLAQPADIAEAVAFLVSDQAGHITMHNLCIDGGATLGN
ncbi:2,3-dihydro-2,3-dihydroxybenzoate dehydrogenase [Paenibacillus sp. S150]|uniref:2,3-dihydro-2,3-dihydroxybenzoate dehydrogenase n=1 Tax=Paenibacillus sp. S150 TaxID=2749826 RepID=UPI001C5775DD|nr:2,3-dihydro-2,3-dihydroxybenzoate dehydrogenase [Paenibacillus sp. S150]MBW4082987.1 2,3-dihydro-2,3-dihydroxybenzoate dehydrogenase [Paenibacillus sp. S150]